MASITLLEMVNRVRLYRRQPTTTVIATSEDSVTVNAINTAIDNALSTQKWPFDLRKDGQLALRARLDGLLFTTTAGSSSAGIARLLGLVDADVFGDYAVRVLPDGIDEYANTALRIEKASAVSIVSTTAVLEVTMPDTEVAVACELHYAEYMLPATVREVVRVTYQERPLELDQVDPTVRYAELFPAPHARLGPPEKVSIGGFDTPTYDSGSAAPDPKLRMAIWPVPDDEYIINYSYYYKHPELSDATDTLVGVETGVVNNILMEATSIVMMTWDQNFAGSHFTDLARQQLSAQHRASGGSPGRRHTIHSFENGGTTVRVGRGFPNTLIGQ